MIVFDPIVPVAYLSFVREAGVINLRRKPISFSIAAIMAMWSGRGINQGSRLGVRSVGIVGLIKEPEPDGKIDGGYAILPGYFFSFFVCATMIGNRHLIDS